MTINPILAFSARRRMRSARTAVLLTLYGLAVLLFGLGVSFFTFCKPTVSIYSMSRGLEGYLLMMVFQFVLLLLVTPAMTAGSIAGERERQTLELLLVTNTGSLRIVLGKLLECLGLMLLLIFATLPAMCLTLVTGGITLPQVLTGLLFLGVTAFAALSVGMLCSALFRRMVAATVVSYLAVFAIGVLTLIPLIGDMARMAKEMNNAVNAVAVYSSTYVPAAAERAQGGGLLLSSFILNPALGLLSLLAGQTGLLRETLANAFYVMYQVYDLLDFSRMGWYSMAFMATAGVAFNLLAACFVRPRRVRLRGGRKGKQS